MYETCPRTGRSVAGCADPLNHTDCPDLTDAHCGELDHA